MFLSVSLEKDFSCLTDCLQYCIWGLKWNNRCVLRCLLSINDNHIWTSWAFYVESIQVEHSGELGRKHRKRERDVADWGENVSGERENGGVLNRGQHWLILTDGLKQHKVYMAIANGHFNTEIFWDNVNSQIAIEGIFRKMFVSSDYSGAITWTRITLKFTIDYSTKLHF